MKLHEILPQEQLDEVSLKKALATGIIGATLAGAAPKVTAPKSPPTISQQVPGETRVVAKRPPTMDPGEHKTQIDAPSLRRDKIAMQIAKKYRINRDLASQVVDLAFKYEDAVFPKAEDILAITGIESSFNPASVSPLRRDPARGLMQVRPGVWNIDPSELESIEGQIKHGAEILKRYHRKLNDKGDAVQAYNIGLTKFRRGGANPQYLNKFQNEVNWLDTLKSI